MMLWPWIVLGIITLAGVISTCYDEKEMEKLANKPVKVSKFDKEFKQKIEAMEKRCEEIERIAVDDEIELRLSEEVINNTEDAVRMRRRIEKKFPELYANNITVVMCMLAEHGKIPRNVAQFGISIISQKAGEDFEGNYLYQRWLNAAKKQKEFLIWYNDIFKEAGMNYDLYFKRSGEDKELVPIRNLEHMAHGKYIFSRLYMGL